MCPFTALPVRAVTVGLSHQTPDTKPPSALEKSSGWKNTQSETMSEREKGTKKERGTRNHLVHVQAQSGVVFLYAEYITFLCACVCVCVMSTRTQRQSGGERERALQPRSRCSMISPADVISFSQQCYS